MKMRNVTKEVLRFEMGDEDKSFGTYAVSVAGVMETRVRRKRVPKVFTVKPGEVVDIEEGYTLPRGGIQNRPSYLHEIDLIGKLVPVAESA